MVCSEYQYAQDFCDNLHEHMQEVALNAIPEKYRAIRNAGTDQVSKVRYS